MTTKKKIENLAILARQAEKTGDTLLIQNISYIRRFQPGTLQFNAVYELLINGVKN